MEVGFSSEKYLKMQAEHIKERIEKFGGKLYLEFGGKLFDDYHASRVLPGFAPDNKIKMLLELRDKAEIIIAINAADIEKNKVRGDYGITYDLDVLRLVDAFRGFGLYVGSVVITQFAGQSAAEGFKKRLEALGLKVYLHYPIEGYPANVDKIVSDEGYGKNEYIVTSRPLVVVTAPGPGSGKMATCLSQLYQDKKHGISAGYAKFETFPIWNLPLKHPVNVAYEAATADLNDVNMIDPFHLEAYGELTVNYNRDVEIFPVLRALFEKISGGESPYKSPTDMGVNMAGNCIIDDEVCRRASKAEIIRRYFAAMCAKTKGLSDGADVDKIKFLMNSVGVTEADRDARAEALMKSEETGGEPAMAIKLSDGRVVTGKTSQLLGAASAALLNALKALGGISDSIRLMSPSIIEPVQDLKVNHLGGKNPRLHTDEVLVALSICAATNPVAEIAMQQLEKLKGCEAHSTVILSQVDENLMKKLGINLTCEPVYESKKLYHK
ncbi:MAG: DUF1846 domain-containing protein [Oscillospiraceae bacterium]|nr:DUF1846 domain-containing protein [Oscillospiraceae bacterium]